MFPSQRLQLRRCISHKNILHNTQGLCTTLSCKGLVHQPISPLVLLPWHKLPVYLHFTQLLDGFTRASHLLHKFRLLALVAFSQEPNDKLAVTPYDNVLGPSRQLVFVKVPDRLQHGLTLSLVVGATLGTIQLSTSSQTLPIIPEHYKAASPHTFATAAIKVHNKCARYISTTPLRSGVRRTQNPLLVFPLLFLSVLFTRRRVLHSRNLPLYSPSPLSYGEGSSIATKFQEQSLDTQRRVLA